MLWAWYVLLALLGVLALLAVIAHVFVERVAPWSVSGKRILITGGSSGVGTNGTQRDGDAGQGRDR